MYILLLCFVSQTKLTVYPERRAESSYSGVPWWIIFLTVLFALMLLALLAFLLWKVGLKAINDLLMFPVLFFWKNFLKVLLF